MSSNNSANDDVAGPLVFSCSKCKTIVGDSFALFSSNQEMNTITLSASSNIQRTKDIFTSQDKQDQGSSYFGFVCSVCQQNLGKFYITTNNDIDSLREKFTFDIDAITSYELGKSQHGKALESSVPKAESQKQAQSIVQLQEELLKMQVVIINLSERLVAVESNSAEKPKSGGVRSELGSRTVSAALVDDRNASQKPKR